MPVSVRGRMQRQRTRDTQPELAVRRELHRRGLRYRVDRRVADGVRSRADIVFGPAMVAVFVDDCFWHGCPVHGSIPANNREWWLGKLSSTVERDRRVATALEVEGWAALRVWEHEELESAADRVEKLVMSRRPDTRRT